MARPETINNALMWYFISHHKNFKTYSRKQIKLISEDCSSISEMIPLTESVKKWKKNESKKILSNTKLKVIKVHSDNYYSIGDLDRKISPLSIYALMIYCLYRLTGGRLAKKPQYQWIKLAEVLIDEKSTSKKSK